MKAPNRSIDPLTGVTIAAAIAVVAAAAWRLRFGVDFTDESFYVALPARFARGDRPFLDEYNILQTTALMLVPLINLFHTVRELDGVVLFARVLHLLLRIGTAAAVLHTARYIMGWPAALLAALSTVAFVPFNIPSTSYNTLAVCCFTAGAFLAVHRLLGGTSRWTDLVAGLAHGVAMVAYPPLVAGVALFALLVLYRSSAKMQFVLHFGAAALVAPAAIGTIALTNGVDAAWRTTQYAIARPSLAIRASNVLLSLPATAPPLPLVVLAVASIVACIRWRASRPLLVIVPIVASQNEFTGLYASLGFAAWLVFFGALLWPLLRRDEAMRTIYLTVFVASACTGLVTAVNSSNGYVNYAIGGFAAAQAAVLFFVAASDKARLGQIVIALACAVVLLRNQYARGTVYRDGDIPDLDTTIGSGPYAGLRTTNEKQAFLRMLERDVASVAQGRHTILFFYDFPAGYMLTPLRPFAPSIWSAPTVDRNGRRTVAFYEQRGRWPDVVVQLKRVPYWPARPGIHEYGPDDVLAAAVRTRYQLARDREGYTIFVRSELASSGDRRIGPMKSSVSGLPARDYLWLQQLRAAAHHFARRSWVRNRRAASSSVASVLAKFTRAFV